MRFKKKSFCVENLSINLRTFAPIAIAHLYCARYLLGTRVPRHFQARAPSRKLNKRKAPAKRSQHANANISQHCWAQHVACVWPPCCDMLGVVGSNLKMVKFDPTTPNMSQHIVTRWPNARNMLGPTMLRYVALACCDRLAGA